MLLILSVYHCYYLNAPYACVHAQVLIESARGAVQYGSVLLQEVEPIKQDMTLDRTTNYLYAMTDTKVNMHRCVL